MKRVDLSKIRHAPHDGRLLAASLNFSMCATCDNAHVDLEGPDGSPFATGLITPDQFLAIAAKFCEFAEVIKRKGGDVGMRS